MNELEYTSAHTSALYSIIQAMSVTMKDDDFQRMSNILEAIWSAVEEKHKDSHLRESILESKNYILDFIESTKLMRS